MVASCLSKAFIHLPHRSCFQRRLRSVEAFKHASLALLWAARHSGEQQLSMLSRPMMASWEALMRSSRVVRSSVGYRYMVRVPFRGRSVPPFDLRLGSHEWPKLATEIDVALQWQVVTRGLRFRELAIYAPF